MDPSLLNLIVWCLICGLIGMAIGRARGRPTAGFWWGALIGPIGWLVILVGSNPKKEKEEAERRAHEERIKALHEAQLAELRALRNAPPKKPAVSEEKFWVRLQDRELGPIDRLELIQLYSAQKVTLDTPVAPETESGEKNFRPLGDEIQGLRKTASL